MTTFNTPRYRPYWTLRIIKLYIFMLYIYHNIIHYHTLSYIIIHYHTLSYYPLVNKHRPWQSSGLEDQFPLNIGDFQGQHVNLPGCNWWLSPTPLKNMSSSDWIIIPTTGENKIHVPNHQPVIECLASFWGKHGKTLVANYIIYIHNQIQFYGS